MRILAGGLDEVAKRRRYWREASAVLRATRGSAALGKDSRLALNKDWSKEFRLPIGQGFPAAVRWVSVMLYYAARLPWLCVFKSTCIAHTEPDALCGFRVCECLSVCLWVRLCVCLCVGVWGRAKAKAKAKEPGVVGANLVFLKNTP